MAVHFKIDPKKFPASMVVIRDETDWGYYIPPLPRLIGRELPRSVVSNSWRHKFAPIAQDRLFFRCFSELQLCRREAPALH
jgi:hypothetical protein